MPSRILLVDDHQLLREGLRMLLKGEPDFEIVGEAGNSDAAWEAMLRLRPDLVVMDLDMPGMGGVALTRRIHESNPETKVVVLTGHVDEEYVRSALRAGASGYLLKNNARDTLVAALRSAVAGQIFLCPDSMTVVARDYQRHQAGESGMLSNREIEILKRIADGQSTKEIAFALKVSPKTIETHRVNIMTKLGLDSVAKLTKYAIREGITTL